MDAYMMLEEVSIRSVHNAYLRVKRIVYTPVFKFDVIIVPIPLLAMPSPCGTVCSPGAGIIIGCPTPTGPTSERDVARSSRSDDRPGPGPFGAIVTIGISSCPTV
uniref:Uncharacterized protein n=1 Tax=Anopheles melas TaxID=34690 RepID=A0A182U3Y7_9DIPT